jgi:ABC-type nitrate/sulfonate/bicarbonate transport system substrate-binding protein
VNHESMTRARAAALMFGGAAFAANVPRALAQTSVPVRILTFSSENAAEPFFARDMGFFTKAGIDATITVSQGDAATVAAIAGNAMDIGYSSIGTIASAFAKGVPITIIAPASEYASPETRGLASVALPANSTVRSAKDLNGKTFAVATLGSIAVVGARSWMDQNGGDSSTVQFIEIPLPAEPALLNAGRFDAAWITQPFIAEAARLGRVLPVGYDSIAKQFVIGSWFTTRQWAQANPDIVKRFGTVMRETAVWANKNQAKTAEIVAKVAKIDPQTLATMTRSRYGERINPQLMQPIIDMFARYNGFKTFPASDLLFSGIS